MIFFRLAVYWTEIPSLKILPGTGRWRAVGVTEGSIDLLQVLR